MSKNIVVPVNGKIYWVELWFRDNTSNPEGSQVVKSETKEVRKVTISTFNESIKQTIEKNSQSGTVKAEVGASYSVASASVSAEYSVSKEITDTFTYTAREQKDFSVETTLTDTREYTIRAGGKLGLYQAYFQTAGMIVSLNQTRTAGGQIPATDVVVNVNMQATRFLGNISVVYTDSSNDRPFDGLSEITNQNTDINSGFKGKYVYLKPAYTYQAVQSLTGCRIRIQDSAWAGHDDLAKGAGGKFRFLQFDYNPDTTKKFTEAALLRRSGKPATLADAPGYSYITEDINGGRRGDFLYLVFKTADTVVIV